MTEEKQAVPAQAGILAQQIVTILISEDSETRRRAIHAAMMLLGEEAPHIQTKSTQQDLGNEDLVDLAEFFNRDDDLKPSDHAQLCAAYHFSIYGTAPFSLEELRTIAADAGVVLPDRLDMTLTSATKNGKKLFQVAGKGLYKPTASAGLFFKERWSVKPGKMRKEPASAKETRS
jgi:hypothetical protein